MENVAILVVLWFSCGVWAAGKNFAYWQRGWPDTRKVRYAADRSRFILCTGFGVFSVIDIFFSSRIDHPYGWLWPWSKEAKSEAGFE